jgi:hypothetical protein
MARIIEGIGTQLSGKLGNLVFVQAKGKTIVRTVQIRSKNSWSPKQLMHRQRFKMVNQFCGLHKQIINLVWNKTDSQQNGYNLFLKTNMPAFDSEGNLTNYGLIRLTTGNIVLPGSLSVEYINGEMLNATWSMDELSGNCNDNDELFVVAKYPGLKYTMPISTGAKRSEQQAIIKLHPSKGKALGVHLFFGKSDKSDFSADQYFSL